MERVPEWVEGLKWAFAAVFLALAVVGPKILGPFLERLKNSGAPTTPAINTQQFAVVGSILADKDAVLQLAEALNRLCDIIEEKQQQEKERSQKDDTRRMIRELLDELRSAEPK